MARERWLARALTSGLLASVVAPGIEQVEVELIVKQFLYLLGNRLGVLHIIFANCCTLLPLAALVILHQTLNIKTCSVATYLSLLGLVLH